MSDCLSAHFKVFHKHASQDKVISKILLMFPGLNLDHTALIEMAECLQQKNQMDVALFKHDANRPLHQELSIVQEAVKKLICLNSHIEIYCLGHSYGALICMSLANTFKEVNSNILIAPAVKIKKSSEFFQRLINKVPFDFSITSLNFSGYGQYNKLSIKRYKELQTLREQPDKTSTHKRTLVILSEKDKVISAKDSKKYFEQAGHKVFTVPYSKVSTFHHLPLDTKNLGTTGFQLVTKLISEFISPV